MFKIYLILYLYIFIRKHFFLEFKQFARLSTTRNETLVTKCITKQFFLQCFKVEIQKATEVYVCV